MSDEQVKVHFANKLRELREAAGLSQEELCEKIGCSRGSISFYEKSQRVPDIIILKKVSDFFRVSTDYLLGIADIKSADPNMQAAAAFTGLSEENLKLLNKYVRIRDAHIKKDFDSISIEDSSIIVPHLHTRFVNEMIEASQPGTSIIADYCSIDMQDDFEAILQLGPELCRDLIRFKASEIGRAIEHHLLERINYGND